MKRTVLAATSAVAFIALVVASNWLTARYGLIAGFVTAGTFTAGLVLAAPRSPFRESSKTSASRTRSFVDSLWTPDDLR